MYNEEQDTNPKNIFVLIGFSIFYLVTEIYGLFSIPQEDFTPDMLPVFFLRFLFAFALLPVSLVIDLLVHLGYVHVHLSSAHFSRDAWSMLFFTRAVYAIIVFVSLVRAVSYIF